MQCVKSSLSFDVAVDELLRLHRPADWRQLPRKTATRRAAADPRTGRRRRASARPPPRGGAGDALHFGTAVEQDRVGAVHDHVGYSGGPGSSSLALAHDDSAARRPWANAPARVEGWPWCGWPDELIVVDPEKLTVAHEVLETRGAEVFAFSDLVTDALAYLCEDLTTRHVATASNRLLRAAEGQARITWEARRDCEAAIGVLFQDDLASLDALIGITQSLMHQLTNAAPISVSNPVAYALSSIAVRAHATTHDISALLRAALPAGAHARWRTLHELQVVASVIAVGDENTAARYNDHRWYGFKQDRLRTTPKPAWPGETPEQVMGRLKKEYGNWFDKQYGWAYPEVKRLLGDSEDATWNNLVKIAALSRPHLDSVKIAHHLVHADAIGVLHHIGSDGLLHAGARLDDIPHIAVLTATTLADTIQTLTHTWQSHDESQHALTVALLAERTLAEIQIKWARRSLSTELETVPEA